MKRFPTQIPKINIPAFYTARAYKRQWLRYDINAGLLIAGLAIPQTIAYTELAGLPLMSGLIGLLVAMVVYAVLGGSKQLMLGPEAALSLLTATVLASAADGNTARYVALAGLLALLTGGLLYLASILRLGFIADVFGRAILVGYLYGVAILLLMTQAGRFLGIDIDSDTLYGTVLEIWRQSPDISIASALLGFTSLSILLYGLKRAPLFPLAPLLLVVTSVAVALGDWNIPTIADVRVTWQGTDPSLLYWSDLWLLLPGAAGIALLGFTDTILVARSFALRTGHSIQANRELFALGSANILSGTLGGYPVAASNSRTALNDAVGGKTQLTALVGAGAVVLTMLLLADWLTYLPVPVLGALIAVSALRLLRPQQAMQLWRVRRSELALALGAALGVLMLGLLQGVFLAVGLSFLNIMRRSILPYHAVLERTESGRYLDRERNETHPVPEVLVYRHAGPLFFANARRMKEDLMERYESADRDIKLVILECEAITDIDSDGIEILTQLEGDLAVLGVSMALADMKGPISDILRRSREEWPLHENINAAIINWSTQREGAQG
jgi:high affinity sulfate transporter 1